LTKKVLVKDLTIRILIEKVEELTKRIEKLEKENKILRHENEMLRAENSGLKVEIADLRARLESNSHNSNKPPSSDGYKKQTVKPGLPKDKSSSQFGYKVTLPEHLFNQLGYTFMGLKQYDRAYNMFKRNIEAYPASSNVYDSMGELLMNRGDTINSIQNYEKSLKLNPNNENAKMLIKKMKENYKGKK